VVRNHEAVRGSLLATRRPGWSAVRAGVLYDSQLAAVAVDQFLYTSLYTCFTLGLLRMIYVSAGLAVILTRRRPISKLLGRRSRTVFDNMEQHLDVLRSH
jgi:hypothetical protein